jgi:hypothetical protein
MRPLSLHRAGAALLTVLCCGIHWQSVSGSQYVHVEHSGSQR